MMRKKIYFADCKEHYPEYPRVYLDVRARLLRSIMRNLPARGILAIRLERCLHGVMSESWLPGRLSMVGCQRADAARCAICSYRAGRLSALSLKGKAEVTQGVMGASGLLVFAVPDLQGLTQGIIGGTNARNRMCRVQIRSREVSRDFPTITDT